MRFFVISIRSLFNKLTYIFAAAVVLGLMIAVSYAQDDAMRQAEKPTASPTAAMPQETPAPAVVTHTPRPTPTPLTPFISSLRGVKINMTKDEVRDILGKPDVSDKAGLFYQFSKTRSAQIGLDSKGVVRTIAFLYMDGDKEAMSYSEVFGPDAVPVPKKNGTIYKMVRYPNDHFWITYSMTNPGLKSITVVTMRRIGN
jgi:hypothetical protein